MQMTIDIPEKLARQIDSGREDLAAIIERGLGRPCSACSALEIVTFRPSEVSIQRTEELLDKNREGKLTAEEQTELAEIAAWNRFFSLIKARVRLNLVGAS